MRRLAVCVCTVVALGAGAQRLSAEDIVAYAADVTTMAGNWSRVSDGSAAGGQKMSSTDAGWSSTGNALAAPSEYLEIPITAAAGVPYHVWVRLRAPGDSKWNDSVWLQFSDATAANGNPVYRIGSNAALLLNLEQCSGCGMAGWGWVDGAYWLAQTSIVQFAAAGTHTIRIQTREDGAQIDQVVLSSGTYLSRAPGTTTNDASILPRTSSGGDTSGAGPAPYLGSAVSLPGSVNAQDFDTGGEGVAYHDTTAGNTGGAYRAERVDLEPSSDGGNDIGWIDAGEWLNYSVNVTASGSYTLQVRVASPFGGGAMHVGFNKSNVWTVMQVPATGGWQNWTTVSLPVTLSAGPQLLTLLFDAGGFNINRISVTGGSPGGGASTPYSGSAAAVPGTIETERFDNGGEGVAYHDTTAGNAGGAFRSTGVDIESASGGGYDVGWVAAGEWLQYSVNVASAGAYTAQFRVASLGQGGAFHLEMNGVNVSGTVSVPNTGGWQTWQSVSATVQLNAGPQVARLVIDSAGTNAAGNFDWIQLTPAGAPAPAGGGSTITVAPGQDLQAAIDAARPGDTILLQPGAVYEGGLILPAKSGSDYITIRSAASDAYLPPDGTRITPAYASQLPKIQGGTAGLPAIMTDLGAHHWRLQFLELVDTWPYGDILALGDGSAAQNSLSVVAHDLIVDRVYIHGVPGQQQKRGIALNSASTTIRNSYIADIRLANGDSQAIAGWNGPGPFTITNNYLEATGENFLLGGSDPAIDNLIPSDIVFRGNTVTKQVSWRSQGYAVKNLIEFKNAQRVTIDGNIIEYNWSGGQSGHAIMLTPRNQDGGAPWSVVRQVQITNNVIRHVSGVLNVLGTDYRYPSQPLTDVVFRNNLVVDLSAANWGGAGQLLLTSGGNNLTLDHNTIFTDGTSVVYADGAPVYGFVFTNNIMPDNAWAVMGAGASEGTNTLNTFFPGATFQRNVIIAAQSGLYPAVNYFPATVSGVGFVDPGGNYRLSSSSSYVSSATDGGAIGANIPAIGAATGTAY
ncbi:MAG TPA: carbohydrate-binding protein [Vicinamibacterales bacterium]|nr:carbohydrate-binding protein [Vicinamibacterales bacterium]